MKNPYRRHNTELFLQDVLRDGELKNEVQVSNFFSISRCIIEH